jgi:hypothetical protein
MTIRPIILDRIPSSGEVVVINKSGISFSAVFIKNKNLQSKLSIQFFYDDEDPYKLLFRFNDLEGIEGHLSILKSGRGSHANNGRMVKATELINKRAVLSSIQSLEMKSSRTFDIKYDKFENYYFISLRPSFENVVLSENMSSLPPNGSGIYRYLDKEGDVIYIGKGNIKNRLQSDERKTWGIHKIEYSILNSEDDSFKWESFYLEDYQNRFGKLPSFNKIGGHDQIEY